MYKLRDYQVEAAEKGLEILNSKKPRKGMLILPTGAGKALLVGEMARRLGKPLICIQPSKELLEQNLLKLREMGGDATVYSASLNEKIVSELTFATIGSLIKAKSELKALGVKHLIVDECHIASKTGSLLRELIKDVGITHVVGLTATSVYLEGGMDGAEVKLMTKVRGGLFKTIDFVYQIQDIVKEKFWSKIIYDIKDQDENKLEINSSGSDFTQKSLESFYISNEIEQQIIDKVKVLKSEGRKSILVFVPTIQEAEELSEKIKGSRVVHSKLDKKIREEVVNGFKSKEISIVINVSVLSVGFDFQELDAIILARSTMSIALYYQMLGRIVRIHPDKKDAIIVDLSNSYKRFGRIEDLNYENIEGFGWGLFSKDILLTNFPLKAQIRPTKQSLKDKYTKKEYTTYSELKLDKDPLIHFGKFNGVKLSKVFKENKSYLTWLVDNKDFNWFGQKGQELKRAIYNILDLPMPEDIAPTPQINVSKLQNSKEVIESHTSNITLSNMRELF